MPDKTPEEISKENKELADMISAMEQSAGWKFLSRKLLEEIQSSYSRMANGTRETFDDSKGYLRGVSFIPNLIISLKNKK